MSGRRGFTLIELTIVVVIIGAVTAIAAGRLGTSRERYAMIAAHASLSALDRTIDMYYADFEDLPPDRFQGVYPPEFKNYIAKSTFDKPPPLPGAMWDWNGDNATPWTTHGANFSIWINPRPAGFWERFDNAHDNNSVATGTLRLLNLNRNYCLVRR